MTPESSRRPGGVLPSAAHLIWGRRPVLEALHHRPGWIRALYVRSSVHGARIDEIATLASRLGLPVRDLPEARGQNDAVRRSMQGVAAEIGDYPYTDFADLLHLAARAPVVALDGVTDTRNLGAIARSAEFFGAAGLVLPADRSAAVTAEAVRASAGALCSLPVARVVNLARALREAHSEGWAVVAAVAEGGVDPRRTPVPLPLVLVLGSEERGPRPLVLRQSQLLVTVPRVGAIGSLNVSVAAGVLLSWCTIAGDTTPRDAPTR